MTETSNSNDYELKIQQLEAQIEKLKYVEKLNNTLFEISNAVNTTNDLNDLYASIHKSLGRLLDATNFYIAIYDEENSRLFFPYAVDEVDSESYDDITLFVENSLSGEVILNKKALFLTRDLLEYRAQRRMTQGTLPQIWLGVPLVVQEKVVGIMAVQSYSNPDCYSVNDLEVLISISNPIAMAIERKRINESIRESEQRYRNLAERSHDVIMRFDRSCRHLYVNPAVTQLGYSPGKMIGKTISMMALPPDLSERMEAAVKEVFATGEIQRIEFKLPGGIWVDWLLCPEFSTENEVDTVITFAREITRRKEMELHYAGFDRINNIIIASTDLEEMLCNILEAMLDIFSCDRSWLLYPCDPDAQFYESPYIRTRPEWPHEETFKIKITPQIKQTLTELLESNHPLTFDSLSNRKSRFEVKERYFVKSQMMMAVYPKLGHPWGVGLHQCSHERIWTLEDQKLFKEICQRITDGLNSMLFYRELKQAKNYIDNVINSMPSILVGVDIEGIITQWNFEAQKATGIREENAKGKSFKDCFPHLEPIQDKIKTAIKDKMVVEESRIMRSEDNNDKSYENVTIYPLKGDDRQEAVIRIDDVSEKVQIEEMMIQSEKMLSVGGLAAGMAHEINNPLAGMMQNAQVIMARLSGDLPANIEAAEASGTTMDAIRVFMEKRGILKQLDNINKAGANAADIVRNMLSFAKKGQSVKAYEMLPELFDKSVDLIRNDYNLKQKYDFKSVHIKQEIQPGFPKVMCEATKLQQVFINILKNGIEAMQAHRDMLDSPPEFIVRFLYFQGTACVEISDNGPGMDEKTRNRIFEPFFTTKGPDRGTGLGLSMAYFIIVDNHKGEMSVDSVSGKGSTFVIKLPVDGISDLQVPT